MPRSLGARTGPAVEYVTAGTYQRLTLESTGVALVKGTELELDTNISDNIRGDGVSDALFSWIRYLGYFGTLSTYSTAIEWMLLKCLQSDGTQDLSDPAVVERLQKESRLFARGMIVNGSAEAGNGYRKLAFEVYNVKLQLGEELRLVGRPLLAVGASNFVGYGVLEWRQVGK